jgi:hypothetical protein
MLKIVSELLAKLSLRAQTSPTHAVPDPLAEKMRTLKWAPTEDDRSALKYLTENEGKDGAPLAEMMAVSYLGRPQEPFD